MRGRVVGSVVVLALLGLGGGWALSVPVGTEEPHLARPLLRADV